MRTNLRDVQNTLRTLISDRTIIVGHSADTDLKVCAATKLLHLICTISVADDTW